MLPDRTEGIRTGNTTKAKGHKMIRNIVFDFGGVIADLDIGNAISAFKSLGIGDVENTSTPTCKTGLSSKSKTGRRTPKASSRKSAAFPGTASPTARSRKPGWLSLRASA